MKNSLELRGRMVKFAKSIASIILNCSRQPLLTCYCNGAQRASPAVATRPIYTKKIHATEGNKSLKSYLRLGSRLFL